MRATLFLLALLLAACGTAKEEGAGGMRPGPDRIVRIVESEARGLDPQTVSDLSSLRIARDQFEGLARFDGAGEAVPGLAESWRVSPDGLVWTFALRSDLAFSDGTPIDAALFERLFARLTDPATASPHVALFEGVESLRAGGPLTLTIRLAAPFPELPALLAHPAIAALPLHRIDALGPEWTGERPMVTSGPYRLADWRLGDHIRLEANPRWHGGAPPVSEILWKAMDDGVAAMRLLLSGGADIASDYPTERHEWLMRNHPGFVHVAPYLGAYYFVFDTRKAPFNDARVRRALSIAVEREWIAEKLTGTGNPPAWGVVPPGLEGLSPYRPEWAGWPREKRLAEARRLLAEAGYDGENPLVFDIRFNSASEHRRAAVAMAAMWADLGVTARLFNSEAALHFAALRRGDFAFARSGWIGDLPAAENFLAIHKSDAGPVNYSGYDSAEYDRLMRRAQAAADPEARTRAMRAAEERLIADMPVLPLYFYVSRSLVSPRIEGWRDNPGNIHPSASIAIRTP